jgi:hypothetical protein
MENGAGPLVGPVIVRGICGGGALIPHPSSLILILTI